MRLLIASVLGVIIGGAIGAGAGIGAGLLLVELLSISCFEGACGYFAVMVGIIGCLCGAIAGAVLSVVMARRRERRAKA